MSESEASEQGKRLRLFIALALPEDVLAQTRAEIERYRKAISFTTCRPRWVGPEALHLTLHFLGSWPEERLPELRQALHEGSSGLASAFLEIKNVGVFPHWKAPKVLWFGIRDRGKHLALLQEQLESALTPLGYQPQPRAFSPHLTIARFRGLKGVGLAQGAVSKQPYFRIGPFKATQCGLYQSTLTPEGAHYELLDSVTLD